MKHTCFLALFIAVEASLASDVFKENIAAIEAFDQVSSNLTSICYKPERAALYQENGRKVTALATDTIKNIMAALQEADMTKKKEEFTTAINDLQELIKVIESYFFPEYDYVVRPPCSVADYKCSEETILALLKLLAAEEQVDAEDEKAIAEAKTQADCDRLAEKTRKQNYEIICNIQKLISTLQDCITEDKTKSPNLCVLYA